MPNNSNALAQFEQSELDMVTPGAQIFTTHAAILPPPVALAFHAIATPLDIQTDPYWETELGHVHLWIRRYVLAEFFREMFDGSFPYWKVTRRLKEAKEYIKAEALLWKATWKMLERLNSLYLLPHKPLVLVFHDLVSEGQLLMLAVVNTNISGVAGARGIVKLRQSENRALQGCSNPFDSLYSNTHYVVTRAAALAESQKEKEKRSESWDLYMNVVRCRMAVVTALRDQKPTAFDLNGRPEFRGKTKRLSGSNA